MSLPNGSNANSMFCRSHMHATFGMRFAIILWHSAISFGSGSHATHTQCVLGGRWVCVYRDRPAQLWARAHIDTLDSGIQKQTTAIYNSLYVYILCPNVRDRVVSTVEEANTSALASRSLLHMNLFWFFLFVASGTPRSLSSSTS